MRPDARAPVARRDDAMVSRRTRAVVKIVLFALLVGLGNLLAYWLTEQLDFELRPSNEHLVHRVIVASSIAYILLTATPFVPGVEIGLALLMILGPRIAVLVYVCTLAALSLSFALGRLIPERALIRFFRDLRLNRVSTLLAQLQGLDAQARLALMLERAPRRVVPFLLRYRYLALMVAVNLPGNIVIGGGGGIAMMAGLSRLFSPITYFLAIAVAIAPVPAAWLLFGESVSAWFW